MLEEVDSAADIDVQVRIQLRDQIGSAIAQTSIQEVKFKERIAQSEAVRAQADFAERVLNETRRDEESLKQLVEHFNFLMTQQPLSGSLKDVAPEIEKLVPDSVLAVVTREESSLLANRPGHGRLQRREQGVVDALRGVEEAAIPFDGYPSPVIYPPGGDLAGPVGRGVWNATAPSASPAMTIRHRRFTQRSSNRLTTSLFKTLR